MQNISSMAENSVISELVPNSNVKEDVGTETVSKTQQVEEVVEPKPSTEAERASFFEDIRKNLEKINQFIPIQSTNLVFEFDELGDPPIIKVVDKDSSEIIREIPPREFSEMAKALDEFADKLNSSALIFDSVV